MMERSCCFILLAVCIQCTCGAHLPPEVCSTYTNKGDVYIGGVFSLHDDSLSEGKAGETPDGCETRLPISSLQVVEAMVYAVKMINNDDNVLPNVTVGFVIHDDCSRDEYAMWASLSLLMGARAVIEEKSCQIPGRMNGNTSQVVAGLVGTGSTSSSEVVASTAGLFERPLISYGATGQELLNGEAFPYFFSTIACDNDKNQVILDILKYFEWQYVGLVYAADYDTLNMAEDLKNEAVIRRLCMPTQTMVSEVPTQMELDKMVNLLQRNSYAKVVVLLASSAVTVNAVISATLGVDPPMNLTWVVSSALENDPIFQSRLAQGSLFIEYDTPQLDGFEWYFRSLANGSSENPWFDEFCGSLDECLSASPEGFSQTIPTLAPTIDSVYALAFALDETVRLMNCSDTVPVSSCLASHSAENEFVKLLHSVTFPGTRGQFIFKEDMRSVPGHFVIKNMHEIDGIFTMVEVGSWSSDASRGKDRQESIIPLTIHESLIQWGRHLEDETPRSVCRQECAPGSVEEALDKRCGWGCRKCQSNEIVNGTDCIRCPRAEWPSDNRTVCLDLDPQSVTWSDPLAITLVFLVCLGLLLCLLSALGMIRHRHHPLIKASSRELSCVNILGLILAYLSVLPLLHHPAPEVCGIAQALYVLAFTLMFAPLLLKVNRIYRIFEGSTKSAKAPKYTGPRAQLLIVALLVAVQILLMVITAVAKPDTWISVRQLFPAPVPPKPRTLEIFCELDVGFMVASSYNALLSLACCFYAFKARNVPGNYNEAKFYAASVYTTLVLFASALPVYFSAETAVTLAVSVSLVPIMDGYVTLFCIYLTKLYAVVFKKVGSADDQLREKAEVCGGKLRLKSRIAFASAESDNKVHPSTSYVE